MAGKYVKFQTPQVLIEKIKQSLSRARETGGRVRKGINEVTKCIESSRPALVVMAEDVSPEEIILHIPMLCEEKELMYAYLPTRAEVGAAAGLNVPCSCVAIEKEGQAGELIRDVKEGLEPVFPKKRDEKKEEAKPAEKKAEGKHEEKKHEEKKEGGEKPIEQTKSAKDLTQSVKQKKPHAPKKKKENVPAAQDEKKEAPAAAQESTPAEGQ